MPQNDGVVEDKEDKHEREAEQQGQRQPDLQREGLALGNFDDDHGDEANREDDLGIEAPEQTRDQRKQPRTITSTGEARQGQCRLRGCAECSPASP